MILQQLVKWRPHQGALAFSTAVLAFRLLHSVFLFYYVKVFVDFYHIPEYLFQVAQILYMVWNAINDPLYGYIQDNYNWPIFQQRRLVILYGAPFFAISFMTFWIPWQNYSYGNWLSGVHLILSLCFYDSMFTIIGLSMCCLLAEMSQDYGERLLMMQYGQVAAIIGSAGILFCESVSHGLEDYHLFQVVCALLAMVGFLCLVYTGRNAHIPQELKCQDQHVIKRQDNQTSQYVSRNTGLSMWEAACQVSTHRNFIFYVAANFLAEFHISFISSFARLFVENLVPKTAIAETTRNLYFGMAFILPQVFIIIGVPVLAKVGYYKLFKVGFILKVICGLSMYMIGSDNSLAYMLYLMFDCIQASVSLILLGLALTDVIDEHATLYDLTRPMSSTIYGMNALITKPANSLAPMLVVRILNMYGYGVSMNNISMLSEKATVTMMGQPYQEAMFRLSCGLPILIGIMQYVVWSRYTIRNSHKSTLVKFDFNS